MKIYLTGFAISLALLGGCASTDGRYAPACVAFEGDTIELDDGKFVMHKFTDQVDVDDSGNTRDPFPGYPMSGTYRLEGDALHMQSASGTALPVLYLVKADARYRLLTADQFDAWKTNETIDDCALTLGAGDSN
jgi:hypothetical protein